MPPSLSTIWSNTRKKSASKKEKTLKNMAALRFFLIIIHAASNKGFANQLSPAPVEKIAAHPSNNTIIESLQLVVVQ